MAHRPASARPMPARRSQFLTGLALGSLGMVVMARARLGSAPWEVLVDGLSGRVGIPVAAGRYVVLAGLVLVLVALRARLRAGLVVTAVLWAGFAAIYEALLPTAGEGPVRLAWFVGGLLLLGVGVGVYLSAGLGAGPTDAVVLTVAERVDRPVWAARTSIELGAFVTGVLLGGLAGPGSVVYAVALGPLVAATMGALGHRPAVPETAVLGGGGLIPAPSAPRLPAPRRWWSHRGGAAASAPAAGAVPAVNVVARAVTSTPLAVVGR